jgi:hypothetical protein
MNFEVIYLEHRQLVTHITDTLNIFICLPSLQQLSSLNDGL